MNRIAKSIILSGLFVLLFFVKTFSQSGAEQALPENVSLSFNGKFVTQTPNDGRRVSSPNGIYRCSYDIAAVSDEMRELINFRFYEKNRLLFTLNKAPGSDLYISKSGFVAFMDMKLHFKKQLIVHFYNKDGAPLFSKTFAGANLFGFSGTENKFGVDSQAGFQVFSLPTHRVESYDFADQFDIFDDENLVAIARGPIVKIYSAGRIRSEFNSGFLYPRKIRISAKENIVAVIDKRNLITYSLADNKLIFSDKLHGKNSFRDLLIVGDKIIAGVHHRENGFSTGILKAYTLSGQIMLEKETAVKQFQTSDKAMSLKKSPNGYSQIPWMFSPFDSMRTVWNYYEQHMGMGSPTQSYLHQGLDLIIPIAEPVYSVSDGVVKCVLTLGGDIYWRMAISAENVAQPSNGWLYAHLIESTFQFDVGDSVKVHDYLGDIIAWTSDWGHIHFVEISDSGLVWRYDDGEWGINYNPLLSLAPKTDLSPPIIEPIFANSKFGFCLNETSIYLKPDSLYGDIDIVVKAKDYVGDSPWEQPAFETFYWLTKLPEQQVVFPRTLGQRLNHAYSSYNWPYYVPYAELLYKRDELLMPSSWMSLQRNYYQILTNNNGDSLIDLSEKYLAFKSADFRDGDYCIFVEARDAYGNFTIDSMDVKFCNGLTRVVDSNILPKQIALQQNFPNPFNPTTKIFYSLAQSSLVKLEVFDVTGKMVKKLVAEIQQKGEHFITFESDGFSSGIYFYRLEAGNFVQTRKMVLAH